MKKQLGLFIILFGFFSCTAHRTMSLKPDDKTKRLVSVPIDLDKYSNLIIIPDYLGVKPSIKGLGYFQEINTYGKFERRIKKEIPELKKKEISKEDFQTIRNHFGPFLMMKIKVNEALNSTYQVSIENPENSEVIFLIESDRGFRPKDELIKYIKENSGSYSNP